MTHFTEISGRARLGLSALVGLIVGCVPWPIDAVARGLIGWCCGVALYLALAWWLAERFDAARTRARASAQDQPHVLLLVVMLLVVAVSVVVIGMLLHQVKDLSDGSRALHIALGFVALAGSWLLIHTLYAFHYAHRFYQRRSGHRGSSDEPGLDFPGKQEPDYFDFLYYSFVLGMTSQVSDVQICSRGMRRLTLVHSVLSFAFNVVILAMAINVIASVI